MAATYGGLAREALRAANAEQTFQRQSREILGGGAEGNAAFDLIEGLSRRLPQSRRELVNWTNDLQDAGITSLGVIRRGVNALAGAEALGGAGGGERLLGIIRRVQESIQTTGHIKMADRQLAGLARTGVNVEDVAKELGVTTLSLQQKLKAGTQDAGAFGNALLEAINKKGRGPIKAMWLDLDLLEKKGLEMGARLFKNIDIKPAADALQRFFFLMDSSGASGDNLEKGVRKGTNGIVTAFSEITDAVTVAILNIQTFALKADTAMLRVRNSVSSTTDYIWSLPGRVASLANGDPHAMDVAPGAAASKDAGGEYVQKLKTYATAIALARKTKAAGGEDLQKAGDDLADKLNAGVQQGLISRENAVVLQGVALGKAAVRGAEKGAEVHSPSRATMRIGGHIGGGLALGIRASVGHVDRAGMFLGERATRSSLYLRGDRDRRGESRTGQAHGGGSVTINRAEVNLTAPHGVTDATELSAWGLAVALEREQLMGGA